MMQETENFKNELGAELKLKPGENPYFAYVTFEFAMKPGQLDKYAGYCDKLNQYFEENKPVDDSAQPYFKIYPANDKITVKFLVKNMEKLDVKVPIGLREGLKDIDQYVNVKVVLGANAEEILQPDKPLFDQSLKGFSV